MTSRDINPAARQRLLDRADWMMNHLARVVARMNTAGLDRRDPVYVAAVQAFAAARELCLVTARSAGGDVLMRRYVVTLEGWPGVCETDREAGTYFTTE